MVTVYLGPKISSSLLNHPPVDVSEQQTRTLQINEFRFFLMSLNNLNLHRFKPSTEKSYNTTEQTSSRSYIP